MAKYRRSTRQSRPQNAPFVKSRKPIKITATQRVQRRLWSIRSKILCYLKRENPISKKQLRKLKMTFNGIVCSLPREQKIYNAIQEMLTEISARQTSNSKSSYYDATVENSQAISECCTNPPIELKSGTISAFTPEDNTSSAPEIQNTGTQNSDCEYVVERPLQGMSQATMDDDDVGNVDNVPMNDAENEFLRFSETGKENISDNNAPVEVNTCYEVIEVDNGSFEFNLEPDTSGLVIEEMPVVIEADNGSFVFNPEPAVIEEKPVVSKPCLVNPPTDKAINQEVDLVKPNETPLIESLSELAIIGASQQNTIDETHYPNSESASFKPNSPAHRRALSPYKLPSRSNSFLSYKASGKSSSLKKKDNAKQSPVNSGFQNMESTATPNLFPSENLMLINGPIHQTGTVPKVVKEELSFSDKQKKLKEKVMKRRAKYAPKWSGMSLSEKVSAKFADMFHVRIFDDPVESLTNIEYSPDFENFNFPRLSTKQLHQQMMTSYETTLKMDTALTKVFGEFAEANNDATASVLPTKTANESDSDSSSDEEGASNKKWLKEYAAKTKHETDNFMIEMHKLRMTFEENNRNRNNEERDNEDTDELLEEALKKIGDLDWLKEQEK